MSHHSKLFIYDYNFAKLGFGKEVVNGVNIRAMLGYEKRSPLENNSDISYFYKESRVFTPNNILGAPIQPEHEVFSTELYADFRIGQEYFVYPDRKFSAGNEGPLFSLKYRFLNDVEQENKCNMRDEIYMSVTRLRRQKSVFLPTS